MEIVEFGDIEFVLAQELAERLSMPTAQVHGYATSVDAEFLVPSITVRQTGGTVGSVAISDVILSIDVRAGTEAEVLRLARRAQAVGLALGRAGLVRDGVVLVSASSPSLVYFNPDPRNPLIPRATFVFSAVCKGAAVN